jgi:hypothetical protein
MIRNYSRKLSLLLLLFIAACNLPQSSGAKIMDAGSGGGRTWFDAPLDGMRLPPDPYPVVIHAYDPGGVTQVEFSVNGAVLANLTPRTDAGLSQVEYKWNPEKAGNFLLRARSQSAGGAWNSEAVVNVTIGDFTPTLVPSFTPTPVTITPTRSPTPTRTATITFTPTRVPPKGLTFEANVSTKQVCGNNSFTIQGYASDTNLVKGITIFLKMKDQSSGESAKWSEGDSMNPAGTGWFTRNISPSSIPGYGDYASSWILYQFVAIGSDNSIVGRSQVYSDITQSACAAAPVQGITPVRPPALIVPPLLRMPTLIKAPIIK